MFFLVKLESEFEALNGNEKWFSAASEKRMAYCKISGVQQTEMVK